MRALVREVPDSFVNALQDDGRRADARRIHVSKARKQHARYVDALVARGVEVVRVPPDEAYPDCPFVEDQAVVVDGRALVTWAGHPSRRGEADAVQAALDAMGVPTERLDPPATLDGGDVLALGGTLYVGRSRRTNGEGVAALARFAQRPVVPVGVSGLHLKSVATAVSDRLLLLAADTLDPTTFSDCEVVVVPAGESAAANVVALPGAVLILAGHPITRAALEERGHDVVEVGIGEFRKADGSLTCLSVLVP